MFGKNISHSLITDDLFYVAFPINILLTCLVNYNKKIAKIGQFFMILYKIKKIRTNKNTEVK